MAISTRADHYTQTDKKQESFSDFLNSFDKHPMNDSLVKVTNENAIKQSIRNLVLTNLGERFFQPEIGSNVNKSLFEPNDIITAENISFYVKSTIQHNEPRINLIRVEVIPRIDESVFNVNIIFSIINNPYPINLSLTLRKVR